MDDKKVKQKKLDIRSDFYTTEDNPTFFKSVSEIEECAYEGHLYNQGITMCGLEQPNNADIKRCGPDCPEYCPVKYVNVCTTSSKGIETIEQTFIVSSNGETLSEK